MVSYHISHGYEKQKVIYTRFLILFLHGMGLKKVLTASKHGQMLFSYQKRKVFSRFLIYLHATWRLLAISV
ncbi:hypothetical protein CON65_03295 [Bacillus pseudomycoides]|uniref:Uncharacterized protein n=1 Tax=Bacillus pseudomycoides TaxID=64104 RepID=A0AA91ZUT7_9BACI|nr:hypothetical protein COO03_22625 [Bacillus sp. AFS098217]PED84009.1 hypothetical protein CON65_03295 [Bacillus pseudomycoides]PEU10469.1 hypothetical protein CN524_16675 [Bacillus sp. AFS019443]PEU18312.1 hypothetical protein CN525_12235 [Bacillus sp. AFS014408]PFW60314.1 hypothetical protein COL20_22320 [Bacillus sp. AFS075034]